MSPARLRLCCAMLVGMGSFVAPGAARATPARLGAQYRY